MHSLISYPIGVFLAIILFFIGINFEELNALIIVGVICIVLIDIGSIKMNQRLYKEEKFSVIAPYTNVNKILIIIGSFFVFSDVSLTSLIITLIAVFVIVLFSIDFKTLKLPRNIKKVLFLQFLSSVTGFSAGWLILSYSENLFFCLYVFVATTAISIVVWHHGEFGSIKGAPKTFWFHRCIGSLGWVSRFLGLTIIKSMGLSISILLSFLGIGAAIFFSYIFAKDIPAKKDILLTIIVTALVGLGFYFK